MIDFMPGRVACGNIARRAHQSRKPVRRSRKPKPQLGKPHFINEENEVTRERSKSFLTDEHLQHVVRAYQDYQGEPGFTRVAPIEEIRAKDGNLSIPLYADGEQEAQTAAAIETATAALPDALAEWIRSSISLRRSLVSLGLGGDDHGS